MSRSRPLRWWRWPASPAWARRPWPSTSAIDSVRGSPDGQLWVDLRGVAPVPLDPAAALAGMLRALGVDSSVSPDELEERVRLYRSRLAGQRLLVVLDNAATEAQVRPLLPAAAGAAALVTSRCRLIGLEAAHHLDLDVLSQEEAVTLLERVAGPGRLAADAEAARTIAALCGQLPLALRIVGAKLAVKRHWTASELVDRLRDERRRLDELRAGDLEVRASVALSYQGRPPDEQRAFRLLGLLDTADFPAWAAGRPPRPGTGGRRGAIGAAGRPSPAGGRRP